MIPFRPVLAPRLAASKRLTALTLFGGISTGLIASVIFLLTQGLGFSDLYSEFVVYTFANTEGLDQTLTRSIPLILVGLSVAVCLRVKFWNIGVEGQLWVGAIAATAVVVYHIGPQASHLPLMFLAAAIAGGAWCGICAVAKVYLRANEVITTLLMNYVGYNFTQQLLYGAWRNPADSYPVSVTFGADEQLPVIALEHVHAGLFISIAAALFCWWLCSLSRIGVMARAVAANPLAARAVGIPVGRIILLMATLAGALSGLAGFSVVAGEEYKLTQFVGNDYIFPSIVVAYLGRAHPLGVVVASLAIAGLYTAGDSLKAFYQLPGATVLTIEATLLFCVSAFEFFLRYRLTWVRVIKQPAAP